MIEASGTQLERLLTNKLQDPNSKFGVVETTSSREGGIVVECVKVGGKLKVRPVSEGFNEWFVQFPKNIREEGAQYLVDELKEASNGSFYRTFGEIKKIVD